MKEINAPRLCMMSKNSAFIISASPKERHTQVTMTAISENTPIHGTPRFIKNTCRQAFTKSQTAQTASIIPKCSPLSALKPKRILKHLAVQINRGILLGDFRGFYSNIRHKPCIDILLSFMQPYMNTIMDGAEQQRNIKIHPRHLQRKHEKCPRAFLC